MNEPVFCPCFGLGYLYQVRLALFLLLEAKTSLELRFEKLDDISFETNGEPKELLQAKHHIGRRANLTNSSSDLWSTLRVWIHNVSNREVESST